MFLQVSGQTDFSVEVSTSLCNGQHVVWYFWKCDCWWLKPYKFDSIHICMYSRFCACYAMPLYWRVNLGYDVTLDNSSVGYTCRWPAVYWNKSHFYQKTGPLTSLSQISIWVVLAMCLTVCLPVILSTEAVTVTVTGKAVRLSNEVVTLDDCSSWE